MNQKKKLLVTAVFHAAAILLAALIMAYLKSAGMIDSDTSKRAMQFVIGLYLVATGNLLPKTLEPLDKGCRAPAREQAFKRYAGWTFVIAGLIYSVVWLILPIDAASIVSMSVVVAALLLVLLPMAWLLIAKRRARHSTGT